MESILEGRIMTNGHWHINCHGCNGSYDEYNKTPPLCCGMCGSHDIRVSSIKDETETKMEKYAVFVENYEGASLKICGGPSGISEFPHYPDEKSAIDKAVRLAEANPYTYVVMKVIGKATKTKAVFTRE